MSNQKKSFVPSFAFLFFVLASLLISSPTFAQTGSDANSGGSMTLGNTPTEPIPIEVPPNLNPSTEMCIPETVFPFTGQTTIDEDNDGNGIQVLTHKGKIVQVALVGANSAFVPLLPSSGCGDGSSGINIGLWRTSTGNVSVFLASRIKNKKNAPPVVIGGGYAIQQ